MKRVKKIILAIIAFIFIVIIVDLGSIYIFNKPFLAIKGSLPNQYLGLFYDTYNCPEYSIPQVKLKFNKFSCSVPKTNSKVGNIVEIDDKTLEEGYMCAMAIEKFYEDEKYEYYFNCIKSGSIIVKYDSGHEENIKDALAAGNIEISDLKEYNIDYFVERK